ncbi:hypothetical protein D9758_018389 [Tetrapyrgos nigripes]|uniref:Carboxylic ester hydrolase n=1 Tax=Tetrapyrgos nigripes TaxID=182062 RepID=A0A8H5BTK7_9AGAR|nr:hypothetical protein D9758_018389 [Tetrapyrgos nigripes]
MAHASCTNTSYMSRCSSPSSVAPVYQPWTVYTDDKGPAYRLTRASGIMTSTITTRPTCIREEHTEKREISEADSAYGNIVKSSNDHPHGDESSSSLSTRIRLPTVIEAPNEGCTSVSLRVRIYTLVTTQTPKIQLGNTTLIGRATPLLHVDFFGAIPFAEPPLGKLRLKLPVLKTNLDAEVFDASNFGLACLQQDVPAQAMSEDCLTINIFRPSDVPTDFKLPVLFWTYGGGFDAGTASTFNGSGIVAQSLVRGTPLVYVNFNYRLGPLGLPQGKEADNRKALNLAIKDQHVALQWVQENIGVFGGDKTKVTVFGESAGAMMTAVSFLDPDFGKLARAAIFESGSQATASTFNAERRQNSWEAFVGGVPRCANLAKTDHTFACLQNATSEEIFEGVNASLTNPTEKFPFHPTIDGPDGVYPDYPSRLFARGHFAKLPFIAGTNLDEKLIESFLIANFSPPLVSTQSFDDAVKQLVALYPEDPALGSPFNTGSETFGLTPGYKRAAALNGDMGYQSQRRFWIQTASNAGVKTFGYLFTQPQAGSGRLGVFHSSELVYVYGDVENPTPSDAALSSNMMDYWISFATSLDPNDGKGSSRTEWPQYTPDNQVIIQLNGDNLTAIPDDYRKEQIDFINSMPLTFHHRRSL